MKFVNVFLILILLTFTGCKTTIKTPSLNGNHIKNNGKGIVLLSTGRTQIRRQNLYLPLVNFMVFKLDKNNSPFESSVKLIQGEPTLAALSDPGGHLGRKKFGFVQAFELDQGKYVMIGRKRGSYGLKTPKTFYQAVRDSNNNNFHSNIYITFEIEKGKINYIGELLTAIDKKNRGRGKIRITDQFERDIQYVSKRNKSFSKLDKIKTISIIVSPKLNKMGQYFFD